MDIDIKEMPQQVQAFIQNQPRYMLYGSGLVALGALLIIIGFIIV